MSKIAFFLSHYKRPEYLQMTLDSLRQYNDDNIHFYIIDDSNPNTGLRNRIIDFFEVVKGKGYDLLMKGDADCIFPKNYIYDIANKFETTDADILSPNVEPSNAAFTFGKNDMDNKGYRPAEIIGGLWNFRPSLIEDMYFERVGTEGLTGAISILKQIAMEKEPKIGWLTDIIVEDAGHWTGKSKFHICSKEHELYSKEIGRQIAWSAK